MRTLIPNALTASRIAAAAFMLLVPETPLFWALYAWSGISDMADGALARRLGTQSDLGARLDSLADLALVAACAYSLLPSLPMPAWLVAWVAIIAFCKLANYVSGAAMHGRLVMPHTPANKIAGLAIFLSIPAMAFTGDPLCAIPACVAATFAAVQEGHLVRTGALA